MPVKFIYTALIISINLSVVRAQTTIDTSGLQKYSYLIYGRTSAGSVLQATGFFVSKKNRIYLTTACHVVNGWFFESIDQPAAYPDTLYVKVGLKQSSHDTSLAIDIRTLKQTHPDADEPDIYFIPITIPPGCRIYKLDSLIADMPVTSMPIKVLTYGFMVRDDELCSAQFDQVRPKKAAAFISDWTAYSCSPLVYELGYSGTDLGPGDSGAPAYFIVNDTEDVLKVRFGGLIFGGNRSKHKAVVIRPELVKALYDEL